MPPRKNPEPRKVFPMPNEPYTPLDGRLVGADPEEVPGALPPDTRLWRVRASNPKLFASHDHLWAACIEYFEWCTNNPLVEEKVSVSQGVPVRYDVSRPRIFTIQGLCRFLDICRGTWFQYARDPILGVTVKMAEDIIYEHKFAGAVVDFYNAALIARDLGLADRKELTGRDGVPLTGVTAQMTPAEAAEAYRATLEGAQSETKEPEESDGWDLL